ncbi:MAG: hypothetical protein KA354_03765 [Phycisphaerae bacterium]|nr:hypothetical protein [Phycisphaerae bacterium]
MPNVRSDQDCCLIAALCQLVYCGCFALICACGVRISDTRRTVRFCH